MAILPSTLIILITIIINIGVREYLGVEASQCLAKNCHVISFPRPTTKLFVFGDSYADTGNGNKSESNSWKLPYGTTFPGKPSGRFSDGRVFTDLLAKYLGIKTPVAYERRKKVAPPRKKYGMNFATGGTGVFDTVLVPGGPNMTTQIDQFDNIYRDKDITSSVALVALSGNDYSSYLLTNGSISELPTFITQVVNQVALNLKRVHALGLNKVAVTALQPVGCLPGLITYFTDSQCNTFVNQLVTLHNQLLHQSVSKLNNETEASANFVIIDLYTAFTSVIESTEFETPLVSCCMGVSANYSCGSMDGDEKKYTVCPNPSSALFWDEVHPTQEAWRVVFSKLDLQELI